jgi:hypothetical protein
MSLIVKRLVCVSTQDTMYSRQIPKYLESYTGIAFYTGINDFYKPLRDFLHPLYAFLRLFTPLYKSPFCRTTTQISDYIDLVLALSRSRSSY